MYCTLTTQTVCDPWNIFIYIENLKVVDINPQGSIGPSKSWYIVMGSNGGHCLAPKFSAYFRIVYYFIMH